MKERPFLEDTLRMTHAPPEAFNPDLLLPRKRRVLILASYCGDDDLNCTDMQPCNECLRMCNVAEAVVGIDDIIGQFATGNSGEGSE